MEEGDGLRTRSFRDEDYTTRRLFLRSYPLHFGNDEDDQEAQTHGATIDNDKASKRTTANIFFSFEKPRNNVRDPWADLCICPSWYAGSYSKIIAV
ncbi:hypothetical protein CTI12_AA018110 [Artemisia annua]|uniref:Uncharacterized protein n=1 Tax=Artemisia annua TaxID=35608 RepID=A0A2U1QB47_ARTAN|nr:hypothetical protein CTI12_AA018110 [Artemisia annua]